MTKKITVWVSGALFGTIPLPCMAAELPTVAEMWNIVLQQQQQMEQMHRQYQEVMVEQQLQLELLKQQIAQATLLMDQGQGGNTATSSGTSATGWTNRLTIGGQVRVQASSTEHNGTSMSTLEHGSNIKVRLVELDVDAKINKWVKASTQLKYEHDGATAFNVDQATITVGDSERYPMTLTVGKMTLPFGSYASSAIADPLTKELGEIVDAAALVAVKMRGFTADFYLFNGPSQKQGDENSIDQWGGDLSYRYERGVFTAEVALHYVNSVENAGGISTAIAKVDSMTDMENYSAAWGLHGALTWQDTTLLGEYVQLMDAISSSTGSTGWNNSQLKPSAWHGEISYTLPIGGKASNIALSYSGSDGAQAVGLMAQRVALHASVEVIENTAVQMEWSRDHDYDSSEGGSGNSADTTTLRLRVKF
ncbi:hypothetical protein Mmc1_0210 [Magnetococcus marinus MC-1]|uniref:Porin domain-containing protein n=1 Tax=Magnetococcus marinus (strain ATCC BAA-1437 / JCM 17883 / MC-1) TaxID=156889 RepID=A0L444_MAGMM|nr:LbtU family siderophore porin [Magnetococcus marinus]ABK42737.1 hypothetical protein Mmc1_0210 [Magnetococcus marinus MC-1]